jgi:hypothetical protein
MAGHPYSRRLNSAQKGIVKTMTKANVKPREILSILRQSEAVDSPCHAVIRTIYNERAKDRKEELNDRTVPLALMDSLVQNGYVFERQLDNEGYVYII